jgi:hypothetical protein
MSQRVYVPSRFENVTVAAVQDVFIGEGGREHGGGIETAPHHAERRRRSLPPPKSGFGLKSPDRRPSPTARIGTAPTIHFVASGDSKDGRIAARPRTSTTRRRQRRAERRSPRWRHGNGTCSACGSICPFPRIEKRFSQAKRSFWKSLARRPRPSFLDSSSADRSLIGDGLHLSSASEVSAAL